MHLTNWQANNYKSISEGEFEASPLTVLIGRNNSGKSNIVDSLSDFSASWDGVSKLNRWFEQAIAGKEESKSFEFEFEFRLTQSERESVLSKLSGEASKDAKESDSLTKVKIHTEVSSRINSNSEIYINWENEFVPIEDLRTISKNGSPSKVVRKSVSESIGSWKYISAFRVPNDTGPAEYTDDPLARDGLNLVQKLFSLEKGDKEAIFDQICESYVEIMEGVSSMDTKLDPINRANDMTVEIDEDAFETGFKLKEISAGSKEILTLLTQIHLAQEDTDLLAIEEPELHLHPEAERKVLSKIKNLVKEHDTQVIVATHSDVFVDEIEAGNIVRVERDGNTNIRTIDQGELGAELADLGYSKSGLLQSEAVVFVEGISDKLILSQWANTLGPSFEEEGITIVELEGEGNIGTHGRSLVKLLYSFDIPYRFVIDSDNLDSHDAIEEHKQKINREDSDNGRVWWHTTPDNFRAWNDSDIEYFLVECPSAIAEVLGEDVDTVESIISDTDGEKNADILEAIWQECYTDPNGVTSYQKDRDGMTIAKNMDTSEIDDEVTDVIEEIRSLV